MEDQHKCLSENKEDIEKIISPFAASVKFKDIMKLQLFFGKYRKDKIIY